MANEKVIHKRQLVVVEWNDIAAYSEWREEEDSRNWTPVKCISVGWKLPSNRQNLVITATRSELKQCNDRNVIPNQDNRVKAKTKQTTQNANQQSSGGKRINP